VHGNSGRGQLKGQEEYKDLLVNIGSADVTLSWSGTRRLSLQAEGEGPSDEYNAAVLA